MAAAMYGTSIVITVVSIINVLLAIHLHPAGWAQWSLFCFIHRQIVDPSHPAQKTAHIFLYILQTFDAALPLQGLSFILLRRNVNPNRHLGFRLPFRQYAPRKKLALVNYHPHDGLGRLLHILEFQIVRSRVSQLVVIIMRVR